MDSLLKVLQKVEETSDKDQNEKHLSKLYNCLIASDFKNLRDLSDETRGRILSLNVKQKRYLCNLALDRCLLPVLQFLFSKSLLEEDEDGDVAMTTNKDNNNQKAERRKIPYSTRIMYISLQKIFPEGIQFMCEHGVKFDPEVINGWQMYVDAGVKRKNNPAVFAPGVNKYKQLEEVARYFASSGDIDMLGRILGRNEEERTRARKYIKNVEPALVSAIHDENCDDISEDQAIKCLEMFISAGADVNKPASRIVNGFETSPTPLMIAAWKGKTQIFEYLIQNGADVNRRDRMGENVLHYLINTEKDMTGCIDRIFSAGYRYGINVDKMIRITYTPLHLAVVKNKIPVARKLLDQGADIHSLDRKGKNLIHNLAEIDVNDDSLEFAKFLIDSGLDKELRDVEQQTPLSTAIKHKNTKLVKFLLTEKCEINTLCSYNTSSPLLMACEVYLSGQEDILLILLESGCDVNFPNDRGVVALMKAAEYPSKELASLLLKYGADVNKQDQQGMYATSYCFRKKGANISESSCFEMLKCLLDTGIDVQKQNKENQLLLMSLVGGEYQCFDMLLNILKIYDEVTRTGETVFHFLARSRKIDLKKYEQLFKSHPRLSQQANKHSITPLMMASFLLNKNYLEMAVKYGAAVNDCNKNGHTSLHFCVLGFGKLENGKEMNTMHNSFLECVNLLIEGGADVDMQDNTGKTALMMAAVLMDKDLIKLLLEMGADVDYVEDKYSLSALQFLDSDNENFMTCLKIFVSFGCDYALDRRYMNGDTLIQQQFRWMEKRYEIKPFMENIYCLLASNSTLKRFNPFRFDYCVRNTDTTVDERDELWKILFLCGADIKEVLSVVKALSNEQEREAATDTFTKFANNITLRSRCRRVIRQNIGGNIKAKLEELRMPPGIYDFLLVNGESRVEETFIPRKYFPDRPMSPEASLTSGNSQDNDVKEQTPQIFEKNFKINYDDDVTGFYEFFRWYSFYYIDHNSITSHNSMLPQDETFNFREHIVPY